MIRCARALAALAMLSTAIACGQTPESHAAPSQTVTANSASVSASRRTAITDAVARVAPAVVTVQTEVVERIAPDPFDWFFGGEQSQHVPT